ncbi:hypothetical protein WJX72_000097 [[Myrmecia] bisecta]|uniref:Uncharacterized protein n=1 Tax=[Myrmecia] bisecta TaxID=41462 RepID=A0AAW1P8I5_9CHLO
MATDVIAEARARLASRPSFFGGSVSTRAEATAPSWTAPKQPAPSKASAKGSSRGRAAASNGTSNTASAKAAVKPARVLPPLRDKEAERRKKLQQTRNFAGLEDDDGDVMPTPSSSTGGALKSRGSSASVTSQSPAALVAAVMARNTAAAAAKPGALSHPSKLRPASGSQPSAARPAGRCGPAAASPSPAKQGKQPTVIVPRGKLGAASRAAAQPPQAAGTARKQLADQGPTMLAQSSLGLSGLAPLSAAQARMVQARLGQNGRMAGSDAHGGIKRRRPLDLDDDLSDDDFIEDNDAGADWRQALKSITGYDPSKFKDERVDDRSMEASYAQILAEERRSARMGRDDDAKAEAEELRRLAEKAKKKKKKHKSAGLVLA